ncbi:MAG: lipid-A-disaccharide synthase [Porphyromonas sp.]|nr:lipid-A-disaccharide synthase [Porphyromonas sp.]
MRYFIIAGEASGDLHAADLVRSIRKRDEKASFAFVGGDALAEATGQSPIVHYSGMAFMGVWEVLKHLGTIKKYAKQIQQAMLEFSPDVVIPVDYPGFNFRYILPFVKENIPSAKLYYYISPKVWAWKKRRIARLRTHTEKVLCILPFEVEFFQKHNLLQAVYVGNPTLSGVRRFFEEKPYFKGRGADLEERDTINGKPVCAILCGSRTAEIRSNLPLMIRAAEKVEGGCHVIIAGAPGQKDELYASIPEAKGYPVLFGHTYDILSRSHVAMVTSGTATLETCLLGTPQVVCYAHGAGYFANFVFKQFFSVPFISLVNLIAGRSVVQELFGGKFTVNRITTEVERILKNKPYMHSMMNGYEEVFKKLGEWDAPEKAADEICGKA